MELSNLQGPQKYRPNQNVTNITTLLIMFAFKCALAVLALLSCCCEARDGMGTLVVGVIASKESSYMEEWLAHHFYYGVDKIVVFDNNIPSDVEEKESMRRICSSFGDRCEITDFNMYDDVGCILTSSHLCSSWFMPGKQGTSYGMMAPTRRQGMAMKEFYYYKDNYKKYQWVMMFDVDEFMVTKDVTTTIPEVLSSLPSNVHGVHVPRYTFGTDNHTVRPEGGVKNNYCWRENNVKNSKGMARPSEVWMPGLSNHYYTTRSMASYEGLTTLPKFINLDSPKQPGSHVLELDDGVKGVIKFNHFYIDPSVLVLNHYLTKSVQEHLARRGRPSLNYRFKLQDVYKDDKTDPKRYTRYQCDDQKLSMLPKLMSAGDLKSAEFQRESTSADAGSLIEGSAVEANAFSDAVITDNKERRKEDGVVAAQRLRPISVDAGSLVRGSAVGTDTPSDAVITDKERREEDSVVAAQRLRRRHLRRPHKY